MTTFVCGGKPSARDSALVAEFEKFLVETDPHLRRMLQLAQYAQDGDLDAQQLLDAHSCTICSQPRTAPASSPADTV